MSSDAPARTKEEKIQLFIGAALGVEPYHSFFCSVGERSISGDRKAARREWLAFMRIHAADYLTRCPDHRDDLIEFMEYLLSFPRKLRPSAREDAEAVLATAIATKNA